MLFRRAVYAAMFPAAVILPLWVLVTRGIVGNDTGWDFVVFLFVCPILFVLMGAASGLVMARKSVREQRAVSWWDAIGLTLLWVALVASGIFAVSALAATVAILVIALFWLAVWELVTETRNRVTNFMTALDATAQGATSRVTPTNAPVIVITPKN